MTVLGQPGIGVRDPAPGVHLAVLPGTDWAVWRHALVRTTGFAADGIEVFHEPELAAVADSYLAATAGREDFDSAFAGAVLRSSAAVRAVALDPRFREAVTWQNPSARSAVDKIAAAPGHAPRNRRERERERVIARYWQRYCAKTETIGFFGPVCWASVDPSARQVTVRPGGSLLRQRRVFLEHWAVTQVGVQLAADLALRCWLPPSLQPHLCLRHGQVLDPAKPPRDLSAAEIAVLELCDGRRTARDVALTAAAQPRSGLRKPDDVYLLLDRLAADGLVRWGLDVPVHLDCEQMLRERILSVGDPAAQSRALTVADRLSAARVELSATAGQPDALPTAIARLESEFAAATGCGPTRNAGAAYAGRRLYWEEATRDLTITIGQPVTEAITRPLAVVLPTARWLTAALADVYYSALSDLHADLAAGLGSPQVPLGQLWFLAQGLFYGSGSRPADEVTAEFARRWGQLFGLGPADLDLPEVRVSSSGMAGAANRLFPAQCPGWPNARIHSPDLHICAESLDAVNSGDFVTVLSELHVAWATCANAAAVSGHPDPAALRAAWAADVGPGQIRPLLPAEWPRNTPRLAFGLDHRDDALLGILPAPGADPDRLVPVTSVHVTRSETGVLAAQADDGRQWPLLAVFAQPLSEVSVEAFKLVSAAGHTPRIMIDQMVVTRETWRTTIGESGLLTAAADDTARFLAIRRWSAGLGLPDRVFAKLGTETKPVFVDLTSPLYAASFHHMIRAAHTAGGDDVGLCLTEMLPLPRHAWLPDAQGNRYFAEIRLQMRDPAQPRCAAEVPS